jgi:cytidyltransferase-like protein
MLGRTVLTIGTFDTPHIGHAVLLRRCEDFGDRVIVGVNTDSFVQQYRGTPPSFNYSERSALVSRLGYTVHPNRSAGRELIEQVRPNVLAIGSDWAVRDYYKQIDVDQSWLNERDISMVYIPYTPGISSTDLRGRLGSQ